MIGLYSPCYIYSKQASGNRGQTHHLLYRMQCVRFASGERPVAKNVFIYFSWKGFNKYLHLESTRGVGDTWLVVGIGGFKLVGIADRREGRIHLPLYIYIRTRKT